MYNWILKRSLKQTNWNFPCGKRSNYRSFSLQTFGIGRSCWAVGLLQTLRLQQWFEALPLLQLKLRSCFWGALKVTSQFLKEVILWNWKCKLSHLLLPLRCSEISPISFSISTAISTKTMCLTWEKSCKMLGKESQLAGMFFLSLPEPPKSDGGGQTTSRDFRRWQHSGIHQDRCRLLKSRLPF